MNIPSNLGFSLPSVLTEHQGNLIKRNLALAVGWLPLVGAIAGIWHMVQGWKLDAGIGGRDHAQIARGVVEVLGLGALLLIPDLIATIGRVARPAKFSSGLSAL